MGITFCNTTLIVNQIRKRECFCVKLLQEKQYFLSIPYQFGMIQVQFLDHCVGRNILPRIRRDGSRQGKPKPVSTFRILGLNETVFVEPVVLCCTAGLGPMTRIGFMAAAKI